MIATHIANTPIKIDVTGRCAADNSLGSAGGAGGAGGAATEVTATAIETTFEMEVRPCADFFWCRVSCSMHVCVHTCIHISVNMSVPLSITDAIPYKCSKYMYK